MVRPPGKSYANTLNVRRPRRQRSKKSTIENKRILDHHLKKTSFIRIVKMSKINISNISKISKNIKKYQKISII